MKKLISLVVVTFLLTSCFWKTEEKVETNSWATQVENTKTEADTDTKEKTATWEVETATGNLENTSTWETIEWDSKEEKDSNVIWEKAETTEEKKIETKVETTNVKTTEIKVEKKADTVSAKNVDKDMDEVMNMLEDIFDEAK